MLSPFLFGVYIDELSLCLRSVNIGCRLSNMIVNRLLFADDAVIFAPSAKGLQQLLDICSKFASSHNVVFNVVKSQCLIVSSRSDFIRHPTFQLSGASLPYTECYKYLGHMINSDRTDLSIESGSGPIQLAQARYQTAHRSVAESPPHCIECAAAHTAGQKARKNQ